MKALLFGLALVWAAPAFAADAALAVTGQVTTRLNLSLAQVKALPPVTVKISFDTMHGPESATYTGALLLDIVKKAGPVDGPGKGAALQHVILAHGRDGYGVALAIGEIDPRMAAKQVLVAYEENGKALDKQTFRLVVPGDAHGGRSVNDLVSLTIN